MPIRPENKKRYPKNWKEIRTQILDRAKHKCEFCGVENHVWGYRKEDGIFVRAVFTSPVKPFRIVLTIAHMDHTPENNDPANLKALCQQCHNRYDAKFRAANRKKNNPTPEKAE